MRSDVHSQALKVLIAEDESFVALDLAYVVAEAGHVVIGPCANFAQVKKAAAEVPPDVALIDIQLGRDSGKDVCAYLHKEYRTTCVFVTAHPSSSIEDRFGAIGSVTKPYSVRYIPSLLQYMDAIRAGQRAEPPSFLNLF
jgi:DNA-binding LytR/AlgR family response regulator